MLAVLYVEDVWQPDRKAEAQVLGSPAQCIRCDYILNSGRLRWWTVVCSARFRPFGLTPQRSSPLLRRIVPLQPDMRGGLTFARGREAFLIHPSVGSWPGDVTTTAVA